MAVLAPERDETEIRDIPGTRWPVDGGGNGPGTGGPGSDGPGGESPESDVPARYTRRRRSIWPFLLDLGLASALFGWIITGRFLIVIGGVLFVVALIGWIREARAEYVALRDK
jgi:hypothetical protein